MAGNFFQASQRLSNEVASSLKEERNILMNESDAERVRREVDADKSLRTREDVERQRAAKAQAIIDSEQSDYERETGDKFRKEGPILKQEPDLTTAEGRKQYIDSQESDFEKTAKEVDADKSPRTMADVERQRAHGAGKDIAKEKSDYELEKERIEREQKEEKEKDARLIELGQKLEDARKFYVEQDREMDKGASIWKKITGFGKRLESGTLKQTFDEADARYQSALRDYKDAILATEVKDEETAETVAEWITKGEFLNLERERLDGKVKEEKGWSSKIVDGYLGMADRYRKLSTTKKIAIGLGITVAGFGIGLTGGTVLAGGLLTSRQFFSMSVSGLGFKGIFEAAAKKNRENKGTEEAKKIIKTSKIEEEEDIKKNLLNQILNQKIGEIDSQIQKEKRNNKIRTGMAIVSGVTLSFIARYLGKEAMEHSGASKVVKTAGGKIFDILGKGHGSVFPVETISAHHPGEQSFLHGETADEQSVIGVKGSIPEKATEFSDNDANKFVEGLKQEEILKAKIAAEDLVKGAEIKEAVPLVVKPGSSLEGTIIQHLKAQGMNPDEAGKKAHLMALEFLNNDQSATEHHLIHPDAKIMLDASGEKIVSVEDAGHITLAPSAENASGLNYEKLVENQEGYLKMEDAPSLDVVAPESTPSADVAVETEGTSSNAVDIEPEALQKINEVVSQRNMDVVSDYSPDILQKMALDSDAKFIKSIKDYAFGSDAGLWSAERDVPVKDILANESSSPVHEKMLKFFNHLMKIKNTGEIPEAKFDIFKNQLRPKGDEQLFKWMMRIAKLTREYKVTKL